MVFEGVPSALKPAQLFIDREAIKDATALGALYIKNLKSSLEAEKNREVPCAAVATEEAPCADDVPSKSFNVSDAVEKRTWNLNSPRYHQACATVMAELNVKKKPVLPEIHCPGVTMKQAQALLEADDWIINKGILDYKANAGTLVTTPWAVVGDDSSEANAGSWMRQINYTIRMDEIPGFVRRLIGMKEDPGVKHIARLRCSENEIVMTCRTITTGVPFSKFFHTEDIAWIRPAPQGGVFLKSFQDVVFGSIPLILRPVQVFVAAAANKDAKALSVIHSKNLMELCIPRGDARRATR